MSLSVVHHLQLVLNVTQEDIGLREQLVLLS